MMKKLKKAKLWELGIFFNQDFAETMMTLAEVRKNNPEKYREFWETLEDTIKKTRKILEKHGTVKQFYNKTKKTEIMVD